jgi:hypothetical protein
MLFYAEPTRTYDVDVFVMPSAQGSGLVSLGSVYDWARRRGFLEKSEHILIYQVPVQFLPAHNALAEDAVATARTLDYDGVPVRVIGPEHLAALAFQAGGRTRRERAAQAALPVREKVRILLALQRQDLPLIQRHRALKPWKNLGLLSRRNRAPSAPIQVCSGDPAR